MGGKGVGRDVEVEIWAKLQAKQQRSHGCTRWGFRSNIKRFKGQDDEHEDYCTK